MWKERQVQRRQPHAGIRGVAYAVTWLVIIFPLWLMSLIVQSHYEYVPPMWLGLWVAWFPMLVIALREIWLVLRHR